MASETKPWSEDEYLNSVQYVRDDLSDATQRFMEYRQTLGESAELTQMAFRRMRQLVDEVAAAEQRGSRY